MRVQARVTEVKDVEVSALSALDELKKLYLESIGVPVDSWTYNGHWHHDENDPHGGFTIQDRPTTNEEKSVIDALSVLRKRLGEGA